MIYTIDTTKRTMVDSKQGEIKTSNAVLDRSLISMYLDIESLPESLQIKIDKDIHEEAVEKFHEYEQRYKKYGITLENLKMKETFKGLVLDLDDGEISLSYLIGAVDTTDHIDSDIRIPSNIDKSELKPIVMKAIEQIYFK